MDQFTHPDPARRAALRGFAAVAAASGIASLLPAGASAAATGATPVAFERPAQVPGVQPFKAAVPQAALDDLRLRLSLARWPEQATVPDWSQGVPLERLQALVQGRSQAERLPAVHHAYRRPRHPLPARAFQACGRAADRADARLAGFGV